MTQVGWRRQQPQAVQGTDGKHHTALQNTALRAASFRTQIRLFDYEALTRNRNITMFDKVSRELIKLEIKEPIIPAILIIL